MVSVADGCVAVSGSQSQQEYKTGLFVSSKKLCLHVREVDREKKAPKECLLEVFCPLPGLLPELVMEWMPQQIKVTLIQIIQKCETSNHAWGGQKITLLSF